jgi:hypothetical protein
MRAALIYARVPSDKQREDHTIASQNVTELQHRPDFSRGL